MFEHELARAAPERLLRAGTARPVPVQRRLIVGTTRDPMEREADRVADEIVGRITGSAVSPVHVTPLSGSDRNVVRRLPIDMIKPGKRYRYVRYSDPDNGVIDDTRPTGISTVAKVTDMCSFDDGTVVGPDDVLEELPDDLSTPVSSLLLDQANAALDKAGPELHEAVIKAFPKLGAFGVPRTAAPVLTRTSLLSMLLDFSAHPEGFDQWARGVNLFTILHEFTSGHVASCFETAAVLFNLCTAERRVNQAFEGRGESPEATFLTKSRGKGSKAYLTSCCVELSNAANTLCTQLQAAVLQPVPCVFQVKFGQHGFCVITCNRRIEVIQSFAGASGAQLSEYLEGNVKGLLSFGVDPFCQLLLDIVNPDDRWRGQRAQLILFQGLAEYVPTADALGTRKANYKIDWAQSQLCWRAAPFEIGADALLKYLFERLLTTIQTVTALFSKEASSGEASTKRKGRTTRSGDGTKRRKGDK